MTALSVLCPLVPMYSALLSSIFKPCFTNVYTTIRFTCKIIDFEISKCYKATISRDLFLQFMLDTC